MRAGGFVRAVVVTLSTLILLSPGILMAISWGTTLNLEVSLAGVLLSIAISIWRPAFRWIVAVPSALVIAVPPFPYWLRWDQVSGYRLSFFHGFTFDKEIITTFSFVFVAALLLFSVMFWAVRRPAAFGKQK